MKIDKKQKAEICKCYSQITIIYNIGTETNGQY